MTKKPRIENMIKNLETRNLPYRGSSHDQLVKDIEDRLLMSRIPYQIVRHNVEYFAHKGNKNHVIGECDVWARYTNRYGKEYNLFFEIKTGCNGHVLEQLKKDNLFLGSNYNCIDFIVNSKDKIHRVKV